MWRYLLPGLLFVALGAVFAFTLARIDRGELDVRQIQSPLIGKPAPVFELPSVEDPSRRVSSAKLAGRPYLLNVWGTWCFACREEHAALLEIASQGAVPIIGLDWKDERAAAQEWLARLGNPYAEVAFDQEGRVAIDFGVYGAPETFLVSPQGVIVAKHIGPMTPAIFRAEFLPLLANMGAP
jgi:cytochrome c biogenesis protein CcmG/thiol:disulfide interchange protein DsbE